MTDNFLNPEEEAVFAAMEAFTAEDAAKVASIKDVPQWLAPIVGEFHPVYFSESPAREVLLDCGMTEQQIGIAGFEQVYVMYYPDHTFRQPPTIRFAWAATGFVPYEHRAVELIVSEGKLIYE